MNAVISFADIIDVFPDSRLTLPPFQNAVNANTGSLRSNLASPNTAYRTFCILLVTSPACPPGPLPPARPSLHQVGSTPLSRSSSKVRGRQSTPVSATTTSELTGNTSSRLDFSSPRDASERPEGVRGCPFVSTALLYLQAPSPEVMRVWIDALFTCAGAYLTLSAPSSEHG
ncbi:unnamed protein product [Protopolystoma xenopodis]|uniref:Uncharacterized protein n=1 Tax=Protopolystoma xenopodis TaxID=117903 RepID=A0A448WIZ5_9PLAT|nr:unnamed protein product [Protopolystoma xenopodis]